MAPGEIAGETAAELAGGLAGGTWHRYTAVERGLLTAGAILSLLIFTGVGHLFSIPQYPGYSASLLQHPSPLIALIVTAVALVACTLLSSLIAGIIQFEAGLFCAAIGLVALSTRGGPMRYVMFAAPGPRVFVLMAVELVLLYAALALAWIVLLTLRNGGVLRGEEERMPSHAHDDLPSQNALALLAQVIIMFLLMTLLAQTDNKAQVLTAVAVSSFLATLAAHSLFPARPSVWFWVGPMLVGLAGYILASNGEGYWTTGEITGYDPALARALPLDYASLGTAGTLLGYWTSRRWQMQREHDPETPEEVESTVDRSA